MALDWNTVEFEVEFAIPDAYDGKSNDSLLKEHELRITGLWFFRSNIAILQRWYKCHYHENLLSTILKFERDIRKSLPLNHFNIFDSISNFTFLVFFAGIRVFLFGGLCSDELKINVPSIMKDYKRTDQKYI